jgi:hypothetical protein
MEFNNRKYVIFNVSEIDKIDFDQVLETSVETLRLSVDETKTFVKWDAVFPECVQNLATKEEYLTHEEILEIMSTEEWVGDEEL